MFLIDWINANPALAIILTMISGVFAIGIMNGRAMQWLKNIAEGLKDLRGEVHDFKGDNQKEHEKILETQTKQGREISQWAGFCRAKHDKEDGE